MDLSALDLSACQWIDGGQEDGWEEEEVVRSVGHELAGEKVPSVQSRSGDGGGSGGADWTVVSGRG